MQFQLSALLLVLPALAHAATFGSCLPDSVCGFMCCSGAGEVCVDSSLCVGPAYVSKVIATHPSLASVPDNVVSSILCAIAEPSGLSSVYDEYRDILTNAPMPSDLTATVPSGVFIPTSLNPETMGPIPTTQPTREGEPVESETNKVPVKTTKAEVSTTKVPVETSKAEETTDAPSTTAAESAAATTSTVPPVETGAAPGRASALGFAAAVAVLAGVVAL